MQPQVRAERNNKSRCQPAMGNTRRPSLAAAGAAAGRLVPHQGQAIPGSVWRIIKSGNYIRNVPQARRLAGAKDR